MIKYQDIDYDNLHLNLIEPDITEKELIDILKENFLKCPFEVKENDIHFKEETAESKKIIS